MTTTPTVDTPEQILTALKNTIRPGEMGGLDDALEMLFVDLVATLRYAQGITGPGSAADVLEDYLVNHYGEE